MATSKKAKVEIESGVTLTDSVAATDSGDNTLFTSGTVWSGAAGKAPVILVDGVTTGANMITVTPTVNDSVNIAAFSANSQGTGFTVTATTALIVRGLTTNTFVINSITMDNAGAIAVIQGDDDTGPFVETRGAPAGPPFIPVGSVEIGQVRTTSITPAVLTASEISQDGQFTEFALVPIFESNNIGLGNDATVPAEKNAFIKFSAAIPAIHTGTVAKGVYIQYNTPSFADAGRTLDFVPAETSHSVTSTEYYNGTIGATSESLGQGAFTVLTDDNINDLIVRSKNDVKTVKFFPDRNKAAYILTQGTIGVGRTFPVADQNQVSATVSAEVASADFS